MRTRLFAAALAALASACASIELYEPDILLRGYPPALGEDGDISNNEPRPALGEEGDISNNEPRLGEGLGALNRQRLEKTLQIGAPDPKAKWDRKPPDN